MQLGLAHGPLQPQQEPIVVVAGVVEPVLIGQEDPEDGAQLQELIPVLAGAGQSAHLDAEDQPDVVEADLGQQSLEADAMFRRPRALPEVVVDDHDAIAWPTEPDGAAGQVVLQRGRFTMLGHLPRGGLTHVDDRQAIAVMAADLGGLLGRGLAPWE